MRLRPRPAPRHPYRPHRHRLGRAHPDPRDGRRGVPDAALDEGGFWENGKIVTPSAVKRFADLCAAACNPIDDVRGTADYRRHAVGVMARRTLTWTWESYRGARRTTEGAA